MGTATTCRIPGTLCIFYFWQRAMKTFDLFYIFKHPCTHINQSVTVLTSSILVAQVRKSPNIGQVHREANDRQEKVYFLAPSFSVLGSGRTCAVARSRNDGGAGVLDTILVLHQYQFYFFFLHIALFQRGHRRELVFWHNLDIHLLWCVRCPRRPGALTAPCVFWRSRWLESVRLDQDGNPADKKTEEGVLSTETKADSPADMGWRGGKRNKTVWRRLVSVRKVSVQLRTARNTGYGCRTGIGDIIPAIAQRLYACVVLMPAQHEDKTLYL